jgi:glycine cleavage system H protein
MTDRFFRGAIPDDRLYDRETDMWVLPDDDCRTITIGATAYGLHLAGKIIGFTSKPQGSAVERDRGLGTVESAKTVIAVHAPIGCELIEANAAAEENPDLLNRDPYGIGWMVKVRPLDWLSDMGRLVAGRAYRQHIRRADPEAEFL